MMERAFRKSVSNCYPRRLFKLHARDLKLLLTLRYPVRCKGFGPGAFHLAGARSSVNTAAGIEQLSELVSGLGYWHTPQRQTGRISSRRPKWFARGLVDYFLDLGTRRACPSLFKVQDYGLSIGGINFKC